MGTTTFQYQVRDKTGKIVSGTIDAESQAAVARSSRAWATPPSASPKPARG